MLSEILGGSWEFLLSFLPLSVTNEILMISSSLSLSLSLSMDRWWNTGWDRAQGVAAVAANGAQELAGIAGQHGA